MTKKLNEQLFKFNDECLMIEHLVRKGSYERAIAFIKEFKQTTETLENQLIKLKK